jgi:hypothetical protein
LRQIFLAELYLGTHCVWCRRSAQCLPHGPAARPGKAEPKNTVWRRRSLRVAA